jgi:O-antigen ligase
VGQLNELATPPFATKQASAQASVKRQELKWCFVFLWLFTFMIYARPEDMFPALAPLHLTLIFGAVAGLLCAGALLSGRARVPWSMETKLVLLLSAWFVAGIPFAFWKSGSLQVLIHVWSKTVFIFLLLTVTLVTIDRIRAVLWAIILSELFATSFSILLPGKSLWIGERIYGANVGFLGWNFLGIAAAMTIPYIAAIFVTRQSVLSTFLLIATSLSMMWMLVMTASRGGFLNVLFSTALTSVFVLRGSSRGRLAGIGIGAVLLAAIVMAPPVFWERLGTVWNSSDANAYTNPLASGLEQLAAEESTEGRLTLLSRSIKYTLEHPVFGLGLGNFNLASGAQNTAEPNAWMGTHNTFTQISSEAGIPALILFLMILITAVRGMKRIRQPAWQVPGDRDLSLMASATLISLLSFAFGACVAHVGYDYYFFYIVAIACGLRSTARAKGITTEVPMITATASLRMSPATLGL